MGTKSHDRIVDLSLTREGLNSDGRHRASIPQGFSHTAILLRRSPRIHDLPSSPRSTSPSQTSASPFTHRHSRIVPRSQRGALVPNTTTAIGDLMGSPGVSANVTPFLALELSTIIRPFYPIMGVAHAERIRSRSPVGLTCRSGSPAASRASWVELVGADARYYDATAIIGPVTQNCGSPPQPRLSPVAI